MSLNDSLTAFRSSITEANGFISLAFQQDSNGKYVLPQNQREFITDSAFLKIFIAWETFLEDCFIQYMLGEPSILGNTITRYIQPKNKDHAHSLLIGTQRYVDWSNPDTLRTLCNIYFEDRNNPFERSISSLFSDLRDLKTIRNAAAHLSSTTQPQLDSLGSKKLKKPLHNLKVFDVIFAIDPDSNPSKTFFTTYIDKLDVAAEGIANG